MLASSFTNNCFANLRLLFFVDQFRISQLSNDQPRLLFLDKPLESFYRRRTHIPSEEKNPTSTATLFEADSARQREKRDGGDNRGGPGKVCVSDLSGLLMRPSLPWIIQAGRKIGGGGWMTGPQSSSTQQSLPVWDWKGHSLKTPVCGTQLI